jgi:hypothetical protein
MIIDDRVGSADEFDWHAAECFRHVAAEASAHDYSVATTLDSLMPDGCHLGRLAVSGALAYRRLAAGRLVCLTPYSNAEMRRHEIGVFVGYGNDFRWVREGGNSSLEFSTGRWPGEGFARRR